MPPPPLSTLTTAHVRTEMLEDTLLTLEQVTTGVTVLALNAARDQEKSPRVRMLMEDLLALIQEVEGVLATYETR